MDGQGISATEALEHLRTPEFDLQIAPMGAPGYVRHLIRRSKEFIALCTCLFNGALHTTLVQNFVDEIMREFHSGKRFRYETALAALAVLYESHFSDFAEQYLIDLARLKAPEIGNAIRVARECLQQRIRMPKTKTAVFRMGDAHYRMSTYFLPAQCGSRMKRIPKVEGVYALS